jgi:hypothetical protein
VHVAAVGQTRLYDPALQENGSRFKDPAAMARAFDPGGEDVFVVLQSIGGRGSHSSTFRLHVSTLCGTRGVQGGLMAGV